MYNSDISTYSPADRFAPTPKTKTVLTDVHLPIIKVLGLGGGGSNAINRMIELGLRGVEFIAANTDHQALESCKAPVKIQLGPKCTGGRGAGGNPAIGEEAAKESARDLAKALHGADIVFLTAGMGGGTGTGAIAIAAQIVQVMKGISVAIVTTPFAFEGKRRLENARQGLLRLRPYTNTILAIPNERLLGIQDGKQPLEMSLRFADDLLRQAVQSIIELSTSQKFMNVDFANVQNLMKLGGGALLAIGQAEGEHRAAKAIYKALNHPLLENTTLSNAAGILVNFTVGSDLSLAEIEEAISLLHQTVGMAPETVIGIGYDDRMNDRAEVILIATGLGAPTLEDTMRQVNQPALKRGLADCEGAAPRIDAPVATAAKNESSPVLSSIGLEQDLDVPAFLRRQVYAR